MATPVSVRLSSQHNAYDPLTKRSARFRLNRLLVWILVGPFLLTPSLAHAELDLASTLPGPDAPPFGRSLFDFLTASEDGTATDVPWPIEKLIARFATRAGIQPRVVMLPKSRSLQRDRSDFHEPRLVFAFDEDGRPPANQFGLQVKDQLYLGYAEKANQIEVISYNAAAGRYEFQIVHNYQERKQPNDPRPTVAYAARTLCIQCHHGGTPVFGPAPWRDTNAELKSSNLKRVPDLIIDAMQKEAQSFGKDSDITQYHGFDIRISREVPRKITDSVARAGFIPGYQKLWVDSCGRDAPDAVQCRGDILYLALEQILKGKMTAQSEPANRVKASWEKYWPTLLAGSVMIPTTELLPFDPVEEAGGTFNFPELAGLSPAQKAQIRDVLANSQIPEAKDPLFQRRPPLEVWRLNSICFGRCVIFGVIDMLTDYDKRLLRVAAQNDMTKVDLAIKQLVQTQDQALAPRAFRRGVVMASLLKAFGATPPPDPISEDKPSLPKLTLDSDLTHPGKDAGPLELVTFYCSPCHRELPGKKGFLRGDILQNLRIERDEILRRLNWEKEEPGHRSMPLKGDGQNDKRGSLERSPEDHKAITLFISKLDAP